MDFEQEKKWRDLVQVLSKEHGETLDLNGILFMVGIQELGKGYLKLSKDEKINVLHIAVCKLLEPYGYYTFSGLDQDGWPHFEAKKPLPHLSGNDQELLLKEALLGYFDY